MPVACSDSSQSAYLTNENLAALELKSKNT